MKIVCLSDTHEQHTQVIVPEGDVLVHSGDFTYQGKIPVIANFANWLGSLPHKHKVIVAGNHDWAFQNNFRNVAVNLLREAGAIYLEDSGCEIDNLQFWGSPWQPRFYDWAFNLNRNGSEIAKRWDLIPSETNVLITHCPPFGILDETSNNGSQGCEKLRNRLSHLDHLKAHIFGHLHHDGGKVKDHLGVKFVNAAICTDNYKPTNLPVVIDI